MPKLLKRTTRLNLTKNIQNTAKKALLQEAKAIEKVANYIDGEFEQIVELILAMNGRVVVTGNRQSSRRRELGNDQFSERPERNSGRGRRWGCWLFHRLPAG